MLNLRRSSSYQVDKDLPLNVRSSSSMAMAVIHMLRSGFWSIMYSWRSGSLKAELRFESAIVCFRDDLLLLLLLLLCSVDGIDLRVRLAGRRLWVGAVV